LNKKFLLSWLIGFIVGSSILTVATSVITVKEFACLTAFLGGVVFAGLPLFLMVNVFGSSKGGETRGCKEQRE
jgi:hypothetical protein